MPSKTKLFATRDRRRSRAKFLRRPRVEALEGRALLAAMAFHVTNTSDAGEGSLREAIINANENEGMDTIRFSRDARGVIALSSELTITDDLIIQGPGAKKLEISGQNLTRVFRIDANPTQVFGAPVDEQGELVSLDVEIRDLTIQGGLATDAPGFPSTDPLGDPLFPGFAFGGGIYNRGNDVTVIGVRMHHNQAGSDVLPVQGSGAGATYDQTTGDYSGPAGTSNLGPILVSGTVESVTPTFFEPNPSSPGEVFFRAKFAGSQTLTDVNGDVLAGSVLGDVVFKLGDAGTPEAGLPVGVWEADFEVDPASSTGRFAGATGILNIAAFNPPGFDPNGATLPFDWTIDGEIDGAINQPTILAAGGAIGNEFGGSVTVNRSTFDDNEAVGAFIGVGGAISQDVGPTADGLGTQSPTLSISHSSFSGNTAEALVTDPELAGPFAPFAGYALGGAILNVAGSVSVAHSSFTENEAKSGHGINGNSGGAAVGGAIFSDDFSPFIDPIIAAENELPPGRNSLLEVHHSRFDGNVAKGGSGSDAGDGGSASGGAIGVSISFYSESASIRHNAFQDNHAIGGPGGDEGGNGGRGVGGAIAALAGADVDASKNRFVGNGAQGGEGGTGGDGGEARGGAVGLAPLITSDGSPSFDLLFPSIDIVGGIFFHNVAVGGNGGAGGSGGSGLGGAVGLADNASANIHRSLLKRNIAQGGDGSNGGDGGDGLGGAIYNGDSTASLARSIVFANLAAGGSGATDGLGQGGGLFTEESMTVERSLIRHNRASDDGDDVFGLLF